MTYTQAQIDKANAVDLEKFLRAQGETLVRSGKEYRWKAHDSLTVCGNKWFRHSQSKGGLPVDFVMEFYGKSFPEAVQMLTGEPGEAQPEAGPAPSPAFRLPLRNVTNANILNYLTQERKLSPSLVNFFIAAGDIYEDAAHHNVVFVGRVAMVDEKLPAIETVRRAVYHKIGKFTKSEVMELCPTLSKASIENAIKQLVEQGLLVRHGTGRSTFYTRSDAQ